MIALFEFVDENGVVDSERFALESVSAVPRSGEIIMYGLTDYIVNSVRWVVNQNTLNPIIRVRKA